MLLKFPQLPGCHRWCFGTQEPGSASLLSGREHTWGLAGVGFLLGSLRKEGDAAGQSSTHENSCRPGQSLLQQHKVPGGVRAALAAPAPSLAWKPSQEQPKTQLPVPAACLSALDLLLDLQLINTSRSGGSIGPNDFIPLLTNALSCRAAFGPRS